MKRIAIVAGEVSGDLLAARLIHALKQRYPDAHFEGVAGAEMKAAGCDALFPIEKLSVMGLVEVLKHLPELLSIRRSLYQRWKANPPDLFIGVDAPDFNLPLAKQLHALGIPTTHYVSPSVWAWREKRIRKIKGHVDLMLTLFPFEAAFYHAHQIDAVFVGHPLADEIPFNAERLPARKILDLPAEERVLAVLPGSRRGEIERLAPVFLQSAAQLQQQRPELHVVVPAVNKALAHLLEELRDRHAPQLQWTLLGGQSRTLLQASDYVLLASGTAVLEGMLTGRLMVAAYKVAPFTAWLLRTFKLLKVKYVTLPNNLAGERLVPELLQEEVIPERVTEAMQQLMALPETQRVYVMQRFQQLHTELRCDASDAAAVAIIERFFSTTQPSYPEIGHD